MASKRNTATSKATVRKDNAVVKATTSVQAAVLANLAALRQESVRAA